MTPLIRATTMLASTRSLTKATTATAASSLPTQSQSPMQPVSSKRSFASTTKTAAAHAEEHGEHGHEEHYDAPGGWLWGIKPGEKPEKEGWENIWIYGFFGSMGLGVVGYAFKPDTSIQTWALEEARRRLEAEGILKEPPSK